jgi:hypothetical protein
VTTAGRLAVALALAAVAGRPVSARASSWEIEATFGGATGSDFVRGAPFDYEGRSFAGPYNRCLMPLSFCAIGPDLSDVAYSLSFDAASTLVAGLEVRRRLRGPFSLGAGVRTGTSPRRVHLMAADLPEVVYSRPPEPGELRAFAEEKPNGRGGWDAFVYVHTGLRYEKMFGPASTVYGPSRSRLGVFLEGGGGAVPAFPGRPLAGFDRTLAAVHASAGVRLRRAGLRRDLSFTVTHVRCLAGTDHLRSGRFSWTGAQLGLVLVR